MSNPEIISQIKVGDTIYNIKDTYLHSSIQGGTINFTTTSGWGTSKIIDFRTPFFTKPWIITQWSTNDETPVWKDGNTYNTFLQDSDERAAWRIGMALQISDIDTSSFKATLHNYFAPANVTVNYIYLAFGNMYASGSGRSNY